MKPDLPAMGEQAPTRWEAAEEKRRPKKPGVIEYCCAFLLLAFPIFGLFTPYEEYINPPVFSLGAPETEFPVTHVIYLLLFAWVLGYGIVCWRGFLQQSHRMLAILLFLLWAYLSAAWSLDASYTLKRCARSTEYIVFTAYLVQRFPWPHLVRLINRVFILIMLASFAAMVLAPHLAYNTNITGYADAWRGALGNKNQLGSMFSLAMITAGYGFAARTNSRLASMLLFLGAAILLLMSRSATSLLAVVACGGVFVLYFSLKRGYSPALRIVAVMGVLAAAILALSFLLSDADVMAVIGRSSTLTGRTSVWSAVGQTVATRLYSGYGYGFWGIASTQKLNIWNTVGFATPHSHSDWLDVTLQLGLFGALLLGLCWWLALFRTFRFLSTEQSGTAVFCLLVLTNLLVRGLVETVLVDPSVVGWPWFVLSYLTLARLRHEYRLIGKAAEDRIVEPLTGMAEIA